jgi:hypothetical protein
MSLPDFVPPAFAVPMELETPLFRLEPLNPRHNEADYRAWTSSIDHIRATPGFAGHDWPHPMTLDENRVDLVRHADDFRARRGFTYSVLAGDGAVVGCVYIYPPQSASAKGAERQAHVRSWVTKARSDLDTPLHAAVARWLATDWPFTVVDYASRPA